MASGEVGLRLLAFVIASSAAGQRHCHASAMPRISHVAEIIGVGSNGAVGHFVELADEPVTIGMQIRSRARRSGYRRDRSLRRQGWDRAVAPGRTSCGLRASAFTQSAATVQGAFGVHGPGVPREIRGACPRRQRCAVPTRLLFTHRVAHASSQQCDEARRVLRCLCRVDVQTVAPQLRCIAGVDELRGDHDPLAGAANLTLDEVADVELAADGARIDGLALVRDRDAVRNDRSSQPRPMAMVRSLVSASANCSSAGLAVAAAKGRMATE